MPKAHVIEKARATALAMSLMGVAIGATVSVGHVQLRSDLRDDRPVKPEAST